jgi:hypothetical protein
MTTDKEPSSVSAGIYALPNEVGYNSSMRAGPDEILASSLCNYSRPSQLEPSSP